MPEGRPRATLVYNPKAGRRRHALAIEGIQSALSPTYDLAVRPTSTGGEAVPLAREAAARGDAAVFAWGGDGTMREAAAGLLGSSTALGVLPGGTFNVVAGALGLPRNPVKAAARLAGATAEERDVGLIGETPFLMQATAGLDGFLMKHLQADLKARMGRAAVLIDGLRAWRKYSFPAFDVDVDGSVRTVTGAAFVNLTQYAGPYHFVPGADWNDGQGHALLYTGRTHLASLLFALGIALGTHHRRADVSITEVRQLTIHGEAADLQIDGDPWSGARPAVCRLADERIRVLIPPADGSV